MTEPFPPGSHLHRLGDLIAKTRALTADELQVALSETPNPQASPFVTRGNRQTARFALDHIPDEIMADYLADYLIGRFRRVKASIIGRDIARIAETKK